MGKGAFIFGADCNSKKFGLLYLFGLSCLALHYASKLPLKKPLLLCFIFDRFWVLLAPLLCHSRSKRTEDFIKAVANNVL